MLRACVRDALWLKFIAAPTLNKSSQRWSILVVLSLARIAMGFQFQAVASLSPQLIEAFEADYTTIGTLVGLYLLPGIVVALPSGYLGARFGEKRLSVVGLGLMTVGGILAAIADTYTLAVVARLVAGTGVVLQFVMMTKMVSEWFAGSELVFAMGLYLNGWPIGISLALMVQPGLAEATSWQFVMLTTAMLSAAALLLVAFLYQSPPDAGPATARPRNWALSRNDVLLMTLVGWIWMLLNMGFVIIASFAPILLYSRGMTFAEATTLVSLSVWLAVIAVPAGAYLASRLNRPDIVIIVCALVGSVTIALLPFTSIEIVLFTIMGLITFASAGVITSLPIEVTHPGNRTQALGLFYTWWYVGLAVGPPLAGLGFDITGNANISMLMAAGFTFLVLPSLVTFRHFQRKLSDRATAP